MAIADVCLPISISRRIATEAKNHPGLELSLHLETSDWSRKARFAQGNHSQAIRTIGSIEFGCRAKKPEIFPPATKGYVVCS